MTEVMSAPSMDEIGLNPCKDGLPYQVSLLYLALIASVWLVASGAIRDYLETDLLPCP